MGAESCNDELTSALETAQDRAESQLVTNDALKSRNDALIKELHITKSNNDALAGELETTKTLNDDLSSELEIANSRMRDIAEIKNERDAAIAFGAANALTIDKLNKELDALKAKQKKQIKPPKMSVKKSGSSVSFSEEEPKTSVSSESSC